MPQAIHDVLNGSTSAKAVVSFDIGAGRQITVWENENDRVTYRQTAGNVFSCYLKGGNGSRRTDTNTTTGWRNAVCIMPEGHQSDWEITSPIRFVHLHLPETELRSAYARAHDRDARSLNLREVTFENLPAMAQPLLTMAYAASVRDILLADIAFAELIGGLEIGYARLNGGIAPHVLRRINAWIDAHLHRSIRLADLAAQAGLSEFHFHRMFRASCGVSPHKWVVARRIERAKKLLASTSVAMVANACGFSSQSHLTRVFKAYAGTTPASYRAIIRGKS